MDESISFKYKVISTLQVEVSLDTKTKLRDFYTHDISKGGVFLQSEEPMDVGTKVEMIIHPPDNCESLTIKGTIIRKITPEQARPRQLIPGMGIRFDELTDDLFMKLESILLNIGEEHKQRESDSPPSATDLSAEEKRKHDRYLNPFCIKVSISNLAQFQHFMNNQISQRELFVTTTTPAFVRQPAFIQILLPLPGRELNLRAEVIQVKKDEQDGQEGAKPRVKVRILDLDQWEVQEIQKIMSEMAGEGAAPGSTKLCLDFSKKPPEGTAPASEKGDPAAEDASSEGTEPAEEEEQIALLSEEDLTKILHQRQLELSVNYYKALGIMTDASELIIFSAFHKMAEFLNPELYREHISKDTFNLLNEVLEEYRKARNTLTNAHERATYDLKHGISKVIMRKSDIEARNSQESKLRDDYKTQYPQRIAKGKIIINEAKEAMKNKKWEQAISSIKMALTYDPMNSIYKELMDLAMQESQELKRLKEEMNQ